jgi:hypothetical protein
MPVYSASRLDKVFVQAQAASTLRTIPNAAGVWTNTGAKLTRHSAFSATQNRPVAEPTYKTGTRSNLVGIVGRTSASWSWSGPLIPNGVAATPPDLDAILQSAFGAAPSGATYTFNDTGVIPISFFRYNKSGGSSPTHFYVGGAIVQRLTINFGGEHLMMTAEGRAMVVGSSAVFSQYTGNDLPAAMALTTYPAEPATAVNGGLINGFGGSATFDGNVQADLRGTWSLTINTGLDLLDDGYPDGYPFAVVGGKRTVSLSNLHFADNDQSALNNLKTKAFTKSAIDISIVTNVTAGSILTSTIKQVQLSADQLVENGNAFDIQFGDSNAHASAIGSINDLQLAFS